LEKLGFGTPEYMPPEFYSEMKYDYSGDWWAFGCILYEMATADAPFQGLDIKRLSTKILCNLSVD
jgi:serine/threonine protein kinase